MPAREMKFKLSEEEAEKHLSDETVELKFATGWKDKATRYGENIKGDQVNLPINEEGVQRSRVHKENQPSKKLDMEIEEIRRLMLRSAQESFSRNKLNIREPAREVGYH
jgi:hypothetical protein